MDVKQTLEMLKDDEEYLTMLINDKMEELYTYSTWLIKIRKKRGDLNIKQSTLFE